MVIFILHRQLLPIRCPVVEHVAMRKTVYIYIYIYISFPSKRAIHRAVVRCSDICIQHRVLKNAEKLITTMEKYILGSFDFVVKYFIWQMRWSCFVFKYCDNAGRPPFFPLFEHYLAWYYEHSVCKLNNDILFTILWFSLAMLSHLRFSRSLDTYSFATDLNAALRRMSLYRLFFFEIPHRSSLR